MTGWRDAHSLFTSMLLSTAAAQSAGPTELNGAVTQKVEDRLPPETMEKLVGKPIAIATRGDLSGAERALERLVAAARARHGSGSGAEADLLSSFAVLLYSEGHWQDRRDMMERSVVHIDRAIVAARLAYGSRDPEIAILLHSKADILAGLAPEGAPLPPAAEEALVEAVAIRRERLGEHHENTIAAWRGLGMVQTRTPGASSRAVTSFQAAIAASMKSTTPEPYLQPPSLSIGLARAYVADDQPDEAVEEARKAAEAEMSDPLLQGEDAEIAELLGSVCLGSFMSGADDLPAFARSRGYARQARELETIIESACSDPRIKSDAEPAPQP